MNPKLRKVESAAIANQKLAFGMRYDGTYIEQITDNQWEDGTPAWQPTGVQQNALQR
jgi:hypothetical protein